ncbi:hypothetical protein JMM81_21195 [Bacillus sp. V3B]|uniref:hypothetical protein n=1 Tax=Bacillus sp. V3B TaxID=2804915 RepID=UPI00210E08D5|nr:hypothetical protein [Bacillus sp. V3B]MCQ6277387.1 hypothetical protein [Bacillus sp. V3B]
MIGVIVAGIGIGMYMEARFPKTPIDGLMVAISNRLGWSLNLSRISIEATGTLTGFLLSGPVGLGTLVVVVFLGKIIQTTNRRVKKIVAIQTKPSETHL